MRVTVSIITYKRTKWLIRALNSVQNSVARFQYLRDIDISVLVVDNDKNKSAETPVYEFQKNCLIPVEYVYEPNQGIPYARNKALDWAIKNTDYLIFIDDDEFVSEFWLDKIITTQRENKADAVCGPVEAVFLNDPPGWVKNSGFYDKKPKYDEGARITKGSTCNLLLSVDFIAKNGLRFDEKLRFSGGSDHLFLTQGIQKKMKMVWSRHALVYEEIPQERQTIKWLLKRNYRKGITLGYVDRAIGSKAIFAKRAAIGAGRIGQGVFLLLPNILKGRSAIVHSMCMVARGVGIFAGLINLRYDEYKPNMIVARDAS